MQGFAMSSRQCLCFLGALLIACVSFTTSTTQESRKPLVPAMFIFGDSLLDVGTSNFIHNSSSRASSLPYGETYFHRPTGRFSNGLITSDFIASFLGLLFLPPYLQPGGNVSQGANFASAGSGLLDVTNANEGVVPFNTQLQQFARLILKWKQGKGTAAIREKLSKSIFLITTGNNDLTAGYLRNSTMQKSISPQQFIKLLLEAYEKGIQTLYQAGARKIVISGLGPLGCTPGGRLYSQQVQKTVGCYNVSNQLAVDFNAGLQKLLKGLPKQLHDIKISYAKPLGLVMDMISNGANYGFTVTEDNCCGAGPYNALVPCGQKVPPGQPYKPFLCHKPSKYLFWDDHPTQKGHWFVSNAIWSGNSSLIEPVNLKALVHL